MFLSHLQLHLLQCRFPIWSHRPGMPWNRSHYQNQNYLSTIAWQLSWTKRSKSLETWCHLTLQHPQVHLEQPPLHQLLLQPESHLTCDALYISTLLTHLENITNIELFLLRAKDHIARGGGTPSIKSLTIPICRDAYPTFLTRMLEYWPNHFTL